MPSSTPPFRFWHFFFSLNGRVSRHAIWWFVLPVEIVLRGGREIFRLVARQHAMVDGFQTLYVGMTLFGLVRLIMAWPIFAVLFKRLHDRTLTGLIALPYLLDFAVAIGIAFTYFSFRNHESLQTASLILRYSPFVGLAFTTLLVLILAILPGRRGPNRYGADPRRAQGEADLF